MSADGMKAPETGARQAPEAELPQAPPAAPEGHDTAPGAEAVAPEAEPEVPAAPASPLPGADGADGADGTDGASVQRDLEELAAQAQQKADEYLALAQRTQADFENYRKRAKREKDLAADQGAKRLALALLPAIDNLDRALAHAETAADGNGSGPLLEGLKHVHSDLISALGGIGIEQYSPEGERFDPQYHEAVAQQPVEGTEPGVVVEVFQRGYRMGDNVVRPARVVVAG